MDRLGFLQELFDNKVIRIIRVFLVRHNSQLYLKEVSDQSKVSMATTHRILKKLVHLEIIDEKNISKFKVYQLANNDKVIFLSSFIKESVKVINVFVNSVKGIPSVKKIIMHGNH